MAKIELVNISKTFPPPAYGWLDFFIRLPEQPRARRQPFAIRNLNLTIPRGRTMVILGPSGCGKTTLLKIVAGLIAPDSGEVRFDGVDVKDVPPRDRRIGMLFQNYALYPNLTVKTNILSYFFFRKQTPALVAEAAAKYKRTSELLGVEIEYLQDRFPHTLSGGERQRVALGRCITRDPALFLLDEPFSNLDPKLREKYRVNLKTLLEQFSITTIYVTHDQQEAFILADLIAIMDEGHIEQIGTYEDIYNRPKSIFIADFLNLDLETPAINLIDGERVAPEYTHYTVGVRSEDVRIAGEASEGRVKATVIHRTNLPLKGIAILKMRVGEQPVVGTAPLASSFRTGEEVWLELRKFHVFEKKAGLRTKTVTFESSPI